jgi:hypothetical protein
MNLKKPILSTIFVIIILLLTSTISLAILPTNNPANAEKTTFSEQISISKPIISIQESQTKITINEADSYLISPDAPKIPVIKKTFTFPPGTDIDQITCTPSSTKNQSLSQPIERLPTFKSINGNKQITAAKNNDPYTYETYPESWFTTQTGAGITSEGEHIVHLTITLHPIQYHPLENSITYTTDFDINFEYKLPKSSIVSNENDEPHKLVIITADKYEQTLNPLVNHKQQYDLNPLVKTTSDIYNQFQGRDNPEKIKYFVKHAIETYNTEYVLLIGDITQLPIRQTDAYPWDPYHGSGILTDLYYSDIYDASYEFASWDTNNNDVFGEVVYDNRGNIIEVPDEVDLYPDVHIGRIPCSTIDELNIMIEKIITYEQITAYQTWFKQILLAGGDTFPLCYGSFNVFEGEITNTKVGQQVPDFKQIKLWSSEGTLNAKNFNQAISEGVGFVSYAGHGFEHGWGTYRPNAILNGKMILYFTPFLEKLKNEHRTPIVFFDACLTAKLDFNIADLEAYYNNLIARAYRIFLGFDKSDEYYPCFAWAFLKQENGGGIASVGATRPAFTMVDKDGVYGGAGFLDVRFFNAYEEGVTVGEMHSASLTDYQNYVEKDMFTIEEYILLGDPSLRVGGYL